MEETTRGYGLGTKRPWGAGVLGEGGGGGWEGAEAKRLRVKIEAIRPWGHLVGRNVLLSV